MTKPKKTYAEPTMISLRLRIDQLDEIDKRAKAAGLSRNQYMIRSALGELQDPSTLEARLDELEDRISRVEHYQGLGA